MKEQALTDNDKQLIGAIVILLVLFVWPWLYTLTDNSYWENLLLLLVGNTIQVFVRKTTA